jgi:hypothetical protein
MVYVAMMNWKTMKKFFYANKIFSLIFSSQRAAGKEIRYTPDSPKNELPERKKKYFVIVKWQVLQKTFMKTQRRIR